MWHIRHCRQTPQAVSGGTLQWVGSKSPRGDVCHVVCVRVWREATCNALPITSTASARPWAHTRALSNVTLVLHGATALLRDSRACYLHYRRLALALSAETSKRPAADSTTRQHPLGGLAAWAPRQHLPLAWQCALFVESEFRRAAVWRARRRASHGCPAPAISSDCPLEACAAQSPLRPPLVLRICAISSSTPHARAPCEYASAARWKAADW